MIDTVDQRTRQYLGSRSFVSSAVPEALMQSNNLKSEYIVPNRPKMAYALAFIYRYLQVASKIPKLPPFRRGRSLDLVSIFAIFLVVSACDEVTNGQSTDIPGSDAFNEPQQSSGPPSVDQIRQWAKEASIEPGGEFKECGVCPEMVVVPPGKFMMGAPEDDPIADPVEKGQYEVSIGYSLAVGKFEVTREEYLACFEEGGCTAPSQRVPITLRPRNPITLVSWTQAYTYTQWLSQKTGATYRLPSETEWEYFARAGTTTRFWWGDEPINYLANCRECRKPGTARVTNLLGEAFPVGSYPSNPWGLFDTAGNAFEWVQDCLENAMEKAPRNGRPRRQPDSGCKQHLMRGGSFLSSIRSLRTYHRKAAPLNAHRAVVSFRVVRDIDPA